ncbi:MAG: glutamate-cysteine ligase family protein [Candidatus Bathyarchaeota archaeon]|nr:glutamate-cysteine ligase family protein [Candidatus Bathyarchaeota archaeon]
MFQKQVELKKGTTTYKALEVLGPEHEFSIVNEELKALPIVDKIIKDFRGRIVNFVEQPNFTFGKELQLHVMEIKPNKPFKSPIEFEENMHKAVLTIADFLERKYKASLLGTGMHPLLKLEDTGIWPHRHRQIYQVYSKVFNLKQHGWLNIQSFQLNLPYSREKEAVLMHNLLAETCAYLPAICASSPLFEGHLGEYIDNRLLFYMLNQKEVPSITGDVVPEYVSSFKHYKEEIIGKYSLDLVKAGVNECLPYQDWVNSRGVIFRFDRRAFEIRVMDEQECVKSDVALSCFVRALLRGLLNDGETALLPHEMLVKDFNSIIHKGLEARVLHPHGNTARHVCEHFLNVAWENATDEEKKYLPIIKKRLESGNLSEIIREKVLRKALKTDLHEAIVSVYLTLIKCLLNNQPCF